MGRRHKGKKALTLKSLVWSPQTELLGVLTWRSGLIVKMHYVCKLGNMKSLGVLDIYSSAFMIFYMIRLILFFFF